jgi:serine/threonine protein kinase
VFPLTDNLRNDLEAAFAASYAIERELGGGGMSRVFLATERALRRRVVIKVLAPRAEVAAALAAVRRRSMGLAPFPHHVTYLREEGRLAALAGDRDGAIRAYRHYLALRSEVDPALQPEIRRVREELEAVERESADR